MTDNVHIPKAEEGPFTESYVAPTRESRIDWDRVAREKGLHGKIQIHLANIGDTIGFMLERPTKGASEARHGDTVRFMYVGVVEVVDKWHSTTGKPSDMRVWVTTSQPDKQYGGKKYLIRRKFSGNDVVYLKGKDES